MEIIGVIETAVELLVGMRGDPEVTMVGLPEGEVISGVLIAKEGVIELWNVHHH